MSNLKIMSPFRLFVAPMERNHWKKLRFLWLVGTNGARSIVRKTLALSFFGETREADEMVVGDIKVKAGLVREVREIVI